MVGDFQLTSQSLYLFRPLHSSCNKQASKVCERFPKSPDARIITWYRWPKNDCFHNPSTTNLRNLLLRTPRICSLAGFRFDLPVSGPARGASGDPFRGQLKGNQGKPTVVGVQVSILTHTDIYKLPTHLERGCGLLQTQVSCSEEYGVSGNGKAFAPIQMQDVRFWSAFSEPEYVIQCQKRSRT